MKLEFKFSLINFVGFLLMGGLFYWLCPLPAHPLGRALVCGGVGIVLFGMCFVVVSHRGFIRPGAREDLYKSKHNRKK